MQIIVSGSSGLIGSAVLSALAEGGHEAVRLVRREPADAGEVRWDPAAGTINASGLEGADAVVHLAGESIASGRWTARKMARIRSSRVDATRLLAEALAGLRKKPKVLVAASAIGYYGSRGEEVLREESPAGEGFLAELCRDWEAAAQPAVEAGIRVVWPRIGVVLAAEGGALAAMLTPFRLGLGGRVGSGRQMVSWIAIGDLVRVILEAIHNDELAGAVNAVAPWPVTNGELAATLGHVLRRPAVLPLPAWAARLVLGRMADALLLASACVEPARLLAMGFEFRHPEFEGALRHVLGRPAP